MIVIKVGCYGAGIKAAPVKIRGKGDAKPITGGRPAEDYR